MRKILITGGAGFTGLAPVRHIIDETSDAMVVVDKLIYIGNLTSLVPVVQSKHFAFEKVDIHDRAELAHVFTECQPDCVMHLAAGSHADRSIDDPAVFTEASIVGICTLFEVAWIYWTALAEDKKSALRFRHASTDEVYSDLHSTDDFFAETMPYAPSSLCPAPRTSSDHLVRAWLRAYGLSTPITGCSNSYGPYYFPEKLTPLMILNVLTGKPLPVYGSGQQVRDWLYVEDHARTLYCVATIGRVGGTYNIGGHNERKNLDVVGAIYELLEELAPNKPHDTARYRDLITSVADRPGYDLRYTIDVSKIAYEPGWLPQETFESGMRKTVQ